MRVRAHETYVRVLTCHQSRAWAGFNDLSASLLKVLLSAVPPDLHREYVQVGPAYMGAPLVRQISLSRRHSAAGDQAVRSMHDARTHTSCTLVGALNLPRREHTHALESANYD